MIRPNFFIIGAPKCGTTALSEYLRSNKKIFLSTPKEPHYFATDLPGYQAGRSLEQYLALFESVQGQKMCCGEASVYYLYSADAIKNIFHFNPAARLIVMLRNPVEMIYSLHSQLLYSRNEDIADFKKAWFAQADRRSGKKIPKNCTDPSVLQYAEVGKLGKQLQYLLASPFRKEHIHVIFFEDFIRDTSKVYCDTLAFLNVEVDDRMEFPVINPNMNHRFRWLGGMYINTPTWLSSFVLFSKKLTGIKRFNLSSKVAVWNTVKVKRRPLSVVMRQVLIQEFTDDIDLLSDLTGRDLKNWSA